MLEKEVEAWLRLEIERRGGRFFKWTSPGNDGVPDRIVILPEGRIYFVELKTDKGQLSLIQQYVLKQLNELGCHTRVIYGMTGAKSFVKEVCQE